MIGKTGMVDNFNVALSSIFIRKKRPFFLMKLKLSKTLKLSTFPVLPIMSRKLGRVVHHAHGNKKKSCLGFLNFVEGLSYGISKSKKQGKIFTNI